MITLTQLLTSLAYLMGERTVVSATTAPRTDFIQSAEEDAYRSFPWKFAQRTATLTPTSGVATMPTDYDYQMETHAYYVNGEQIDLTQIDVLDAGNYAIGDNVYWITSPSDGVFKFNTTETSVSSFTLIYQSLPPVLDSAGTIQTPYPNKMTLAKGARVYVKLAQNPDADVSQEQAQFDASITKDIAAAQVQVPRRKRKTTGGYTGSF